jgi:glycosyltransferase involved in cell wall biosynthesis
MGQSMSDRSTTVVITTRNRVALLREALGTALRQGALVKEVLVVDDRSEDGTIPWLAGLRNRRVRVISLSRHSERSAARNRGLAEVNTRYVVFLDDDDHLLPGSVERLTNALDRHRDAVTAVGGRVVFNDRGSRRRARNYPRTPMVRSVMADVLTGWGAGVGQWLTSADTVREVGGWDESLITAEEWELFLRLSAFGPMTLITAPVLAERMHPEQWEPENRAGLMNEIRATFAEQLSGYQRERAGRVLRAWGREEAAGRAYADGRYAEAIRYYVEAARAAPEVVRSPLHGPRMARTMGRAVVGLAIGNRGAHATRRALAVSRRLLRRDTDSGWQVLPMSGRRRPSHLLPNEGKELEA